MKLENITDCNKFVGILDSIERDGLKVHGIKSDINEVASVYFSRKEYSLGVWLSKAAITIHEYAFNKLPHRVFPLNQIENVEMTETGFQILFKPGYEYKHYTINLDHIELSTLV